MLSLLLSTLITASALAVPAPKQIAHERSLTANTHSVPIVAVVPRSQRKKDQLQKHISYLRGEPFERWSGDGAKYEFFGPGSGVEYAVNVTVAGQEVSVIFDTGSSDLWFPANNFTCLSLNGTQIEQEECAFGPTYFDITTATSTGDIAPVNFTNNFNISYGDGEYATGSAYIGPVGFAGITVKDAEFSVVDQAYWTGDGVTDGLIGFANPLLTSVFSGSDPTVDNNTIVDEYLPWFYQANADGLVAPYFSIALNRVSLAQELEDDQEAVLFGLGTVTLGGIPANDSVPVTGKNITVPNVLFKEKVDGKNVSVPAYYTVPIDSWDFAGSEEIDTATPLAILDSGTTLLYAPDNVAAAFNGEIVPQGYYNETAGAYLIDCNATIPELAVTIAGTQFFFTREDLVYAYDLTGDVCLSSVVPGGNSTSDVYILGDRFLVNVVASFNIQSNEISIYERVPY